MIVNRNEGRSGFKAAPIIIIGSFLLFIACGCSNDDLESAKHDEYETYYKLKLEDTPIEIEDFVDNILSEYGVDAKTAVDVEAAPEEFARFRVSTEDGAILWSFNEEKTEFFLCREFDAEKISDKEGLLISKSVINGINVDFYEKVEIENYESETQCIGYTYTLEYQDVEFLGNIPIVVKGKDTIGMWVEIVVDSAGVKMIVINNMSNVSEEVEKYTVKDFITVNALEDIVTSYCEKIIVQDSENVGGYALGEWDIIYIPSDDSGEIYWIPGYKVICEYESDYVIHKYRLIVDAFNGYVYSWEEL